MAGRDCGILGVQFLLAANAKGNDGGDSGMQKQASSCHDLILVCFECGPSGL
jgi:hypothetical protein